MSGRRGTVEMTVEVMSILRGVHLVDASKVTGDSVDFYNAYAQITDIIKPLITADALRRPEEGTRLFCTATVLFLARPDCLIAACTTAALVSSAALCTCLDGA